jgi:hypothetical protein
MVCKGRASMRSCDGGDGQHAELAIGQVCGEVPAIETTLLLSQLAYSTIYT